MRYQAASIIRVTVFFKFVCVTLFIGLLLIYCFTNRLKHLFVLLPTKDGLVDVSPLVWDQLQGSKYSHGVNHVWARA